jgi:hypothetical protein
LTLFVIATVQARGSSVGVGFTNATCSMWRSLPLVYPVPRPLRFPTERGACHVASRPLVSERNASEA